MLFGDFSHPENKAILLNSQGKVYGFSAILLRMRKEFGTLCLNSQRKYTRNRSLQKCYFLPQNKFDEEKESLTWTRLRGLQKRLIVFLWWHKCSWHNQSSPLGMCMGDDKLTDTSTLIMYREKGKGARNVSWSVSFSLFNLKFHKCLEERCLLPWTLNCTLEKTNEL